MIYKKRGAFNDVKGIILAIVVIIILGAVWFGFFSKVIAKGYDKEGCRQSVLLNSQRVEVGGTEIVQPFKGLNCPTVVEKVDKVGNDRVFRVLANHLYDCWDKFGRGRINFLENPGGLPFSDRDKNYCLICSRIEFEGEASGREIPGFLEFLTTKKIADEKGFVYSDLTYLEFLSDYQTKEGLIEKIKGNTQDKIYTNNDYATLYIYYRQAPEGKLEIAKNNLLGSLAACFAAGGLAAYGVLTGGAGLAVALPVVGVVTKGCTAILGGVGVGYAYLFGSDHAADWGARTVLVPYQDISKLGCDSLQ